MKPHDDFPAKNAERGDLIIQKFRGGLTADEERRLEHLTVWADVQMTRLSPVDFKPLQELLRRTETLRLKVEAHVRILLAARQRGLMFARRPS